MRLIVDMTTAAVGGSVATEVPQLRVCRPDGTRLEAASVADSARRQDTARPHAC